MVARIRWHDREFLTPVGITNQAPATPDLRYFSQGKVRSRDPQLAQVDIQLAKSHGVPTYISSGISWNVQRVPRHRWAGAVPSRKGRVAHPRSRRHPYAFYAEDARRQLDSDYYRSGTTRSAGIDPERANRDSGVSAKPIGALLTLINNITCSTYACASNLLRLTLVQLRVADPCQ